MILGIGCDIVDIRRITALVDKHGYAFFKRICTQNEIAAFFNNLDHQLLLDPIAIAPEQVTHLSYFIAKRFAAKEAYAKAHGCGIGSTLSFLSIEVDNNEKGKPYFTKQTALLDNIVAHLSISDEKELAIAYVILENHPNHRLQ